MTMLERVLIFAGKNSFIESLEGKKVSQDLSTFPASMVYMAANNDA